MKDFDLYLGVIVLTLALSLLIAGVIITVILATRQRLNQEMKIAAMELAYEKELREAETELQEQLMAHFARELHDNIGHTLTYMRLQIENKKLDEPSLEQAFEPVEELLTQASDQIRLLSRSMNTDFIQELGLKRSIELEINRLQKMTKKDVEYIEGHENKDVLDKNQQLMAYRIFQEILNNSIKHSGATKYSIRSFNQAYLLQVEDNGQGFSTDEVNYSFKASGLTNMKKRASLANMQLDIETAPNKGCKITLKLLDQE